MYFLLLSEVFSLSKLAQVSPMIREAHEKARALYSSALGRKRNELVTPALILDLEVMCENLALMAERMKNKPAKLRAHMRTT